MSTMLKSKPSNQVKPVDVVEIKFSVPQHQVNMFRQMAIRYILDNNDESTAFKLIDLTHTKLRDDIKLWKNHK